MADLRASLRRAGWAAVAVAVALSFAGVFQHDLWTADEPREAEIAREMLLSGFSSVPTLGGLPFMEKPPLFSWTAAASLGMFGTSAGAARVPAALFGLGTLWIAYLLGRRAGGRVAGLASVVVLGTMTQFSQTTHKAILDTALTFFVAAGHLALLRLRDAAALAPAGGGLPTARRRLLPDLVVVASCSGLAFLTKAWIGPGLICAPALVAAAVQRDRRFLLHVAPRAVLAAGIGVVALGLPWALAVAAAPNGGWGRVRECLVTEYLGRMLDGADGFSKGAHRKGALFYLPSILSSALPWTLALPALWRGGTWRPSHRGGRTAWLLLVVAAGLVLLSIPSGKRSLYLVPLLPSLAAALGVWLARAGTFRGGAWDRTTFTLLAGALALGGAACAAATAWAAAEGPVPGAVGLDVAAVVAALGPAPLAVVAAASLAAALLGVRALTRRSHGPAAFARSTAIAVLGAYLAWLGVVRGAMDPSKELRSGALAAAAMVPATEPLLGLDCDETTIAVLPFYTGRTLENHATATEASEALRRGPGRHLIVLERDPEGPLQRDPPAFLADRLRLVGTVPLALDRGLAVFEWTGP